MDVRFFRYDDDTMKLIPCAIVDDYTSLVYTRSYSGIGTWQMVLPLSSANVPLVLNADVINLRSGVSGMITKITKSVSDGNETLTLNGMELKGLVKGRIVIPAAGTAYTTYTNTDPAYLIINLISRQLMSAADDRKVPGTVLWAETPYRTSYSGRFSSLEEDVRSICEEFGIGYNASLNSYRDIRWESFIGTDRRKSQNVNPKMVFSYDTDTLESSSLEITRNNTNRVLVAGQGEGTERTVVEVGTATGFRRFEGYVDARDVEDSSLLPARGAEKLAEYGDSALFTARISENLVNKYLTDFDLGDICTIQDDFGGQFFTLDARITEITECYEDNALTLDLSFGYDRTGLADVISRIKNDTKSLKNKE